MCIMEVRPGQHTSTIAQAMAHNTSTIERDLDMFRKLLEARADGAHLAMVEVAQDYIHRAYAILLGQYGEFVAESPHVDHDHEHGSERRTFVEQAHHDARLARRYETR